MPQYRAWRGCCLVRAPLSAVKHWPADVVAQPLVVENELANRLRELVALPQALKSPRAVALRFRRDSTCGLDRIGGHTEFVRGDVCDGRGLAGRASARQALGGEQQHRATATADVKDVLVSAQIKLIE